MMPSAPSLTVPVIKLAPVLRPLTTTLSIVSKEKFDGLSSPSMSVSLASTFFEAAVFSPVVSKSSAATGASF